MINRNKIGFRMLIWYIVTLLNSLMVIIVSGRVAMSIIMLFINNSSYTSFLM